MSNRSSPFASCFHPSAAAADDRQPTAEAPAISGDPNITTCLYSTGMGLFTLTWCRSVIGRSLHLLLHQHQYPQSSFDMDGSPFAFSTPASLPALSFHIHVKPLFFWKKQGCKKLNTGTRTPNVHIFWDLRKARFGAGPEPQSGFYVAVVVDGEMTLLVGDSTGEAFQKTKAQKPGRTQVLVLRREHVYGNKVYTTRARFGGKTREISIDCSVNSDARLCFSVDNKRVLQIKRLKWKFRGNEKIEVDGVPIQVAWDVYNWLFKDFNDKHAVFMFKFEKLGFEEDEECNDVETERNGTARWAQQWCSLAMNGIELRKIRKSLPKSSRSSSSSSMSLSSASSACSSSVLEWASMEENELSSSPSGFCLQVYAWKKK